MEKFRIYGLGSYSTNTHEVEAETPEQALDNAYEHIERGSICCHCSREIELDADLHSHIVLNEDNEQVLVDGMLAHDQKVIDKVKALEKEIGRLKGVIHKAKQTAEFYDLSTNKTTLKFGYSRVLESLGKTE